MLCQISDTGRSNVTTDFTLHLLGNKMHSPTVSNSKKNCIYNFSFVLTFAADLYSGMKS